MFINFRGLCSLAVLSVLCFGGCQNATTPTGEHNHAGDPSPGDHGPGDLANKVERALAELSDEDRALAIHQDKCPVSGGKLGAMGKPIKVAVDGKTVFVCCAGCEEPLLKEPEKYLAKSSSESAVPGDEQQP